MNILFAEASNFSHGSFAPSLYSSIVRYKFRSVTVCNNSVHAYNTRIKYDFLEELCKLASSMKPTEAGGISPRSLMEFQKLVYLETNF